MAISRRAIAAQPVSEKVPAERPAPVAAVPSPSKGVFDAFIREISNAPQYLTADNIMALKNALPWDEVAATDQQVDLSGLLTTLTKLHQRMQMSGLTSNDPAEIKGMIMATKSVIELVTKHQEGIKSQARQIHLENAVVEALDEVENPALKARFLEIFARKLRK